MPRFPLMPDEHPAPEAASIRDDVTAITSLPMRLLVTRPEPEAAMTAARLAAAGHEARIEPMLTIVPIADAAVPEKAYKAVLATSANAVRAVADRPELARLRAVELLAVGERTAAIARGLGFARTTAAAGDVASLAALVRARCTPTAGPLLYLAGAERTGALDEALRADGYAVDLVEVYRAEARRALTPQTRADLSQGRLDGILLFSARTAEAFRDAVVAAGLSAALGRVTAFCLSAAIARKIAEAGFGRVVVAAAPRESELMAALVG